MSHRCAALLQPPSRWEQRIWQRLFAFAAPRVDEINDSYTKSWTISLRKSIRFVIDFVSTGRLGIASSTWDHAFSLKRLEKGIQRLRSEEICDFNGRWNRGLRSEATAKEESTLTDGGTVACEVRPLLRKKAPNQKSDELKLAAPITSKIEAGNLSSSHPPHLLRRKASYTYIGDIMRLSRRNIHQRRPAADNHAMQRATWDFMLFWFHMRTS